MLVGTRPTRASRLSKPISRSLLRCHTISRPKAMSSKASIAATSRMKARRRASQSCHARLDVVRHVPRNLYPVARAGRETNAPNYRALGGGEVLRLRGFSAGADDFVVKPFSMRELIARVRALLRRSRFTIADHPLIRGDLQLDHQARRVRRGLRNVHLRPTEFRLAT